jgi:AcrR family transcriptional regulator
MEKVQGRAARTRKAVLEAALALFAERGFSGTTIPDVMAKASVGAGSLYRLFPSKEALANEVFREAKRRFSERLFAPLDPGSPPRAIFETLWWRLVAFAREEPLAFRFLELQDHFAYLDGQSRQLDVSTFAPLYVGFLRLQERKMIRDDLRPDAILAIVWGALVSLIKNERLGYVRLDEPTLKAACDALYAGLTPRA